MDLGDERVYFMNTNSSPVQKGELSRSLGNDAFKFNRSKHPVNTQSWKCFHFSIAYVVKNKIISVKKVASSED